MSGRAAAKLRQMMRSFLRQRLSTSTGDPDRAGVMHEVGGIGHDRLAAPRSKQHTGGDDGEQDAIHGRKKILMTRILTSGARERTQP